MVTSVRLLIAFAACLACVNGQEVPEKKGEFYYQNLETGEQQYTKGWYVSQYYPAEDKYQEYYYMPNIGQSYYWNKTDTDHGGNKLFAE